MSKRDWVKAYGYGLTEEESEEREKKKRQAIAEVDKKHNIASTAVDDDYINSYIRDYNDFVSSAKSDYDSIGYNNAKSVYQNYSIKSGSLSFRAARISNYLKSNKNKYDTETYNDLMSYLDNSKKSFATAKQSFTKARDYYAQWETEDDYKSYLKGQEERKQMLSYDRDAGAKDIETLESRLSELKKEKEAYDTEYKKNGGYVPSASNYSRPSVTQIDAYNTWSAKSGDYQKEIEGLEKELDEKKKYHNRADRIQTADSLYNTAVNSKDFNLSVKKGENNELSKERAAYEEKYGETFGEDYKFGEATLTLEQRFAKYATDEEMAIYSYYIGEEDEESAKAFVESMEETINARKGLRMYEDVEDKAALELAFSAAAGIQQAGVGLANAVSAPFTDKDYYAPTATQMASGMVREDLKDVGPKLPEFLGGSSLGQVGYDIVNTTANMLPSILASAVVTYATGGIATPAAASMMGSAVGSITLGTSAGGNAYAEMINLGYDKGQAGTYATMVGASEAGLQLLMGGIGKLGGVATKGITTKVVNSLDNALAKVAIKFGDEFVDVAKGAVKYGGKMLSEGAEEYMQEILDPVFKNIAFNEKNKVELFTPEALYSGVLGAMTAGLLDVVPSSIADTANAVKTRQAGKTALDSGVEIGRLKELGWTFSADSIAYKIADRVDKNTGAYTVGKLLNEVGAELTQQNQADVTNALVERGVTQKHAETISKWLTRTVDGFKLNRTQRKALEKNEVVSEVFRDVIINKNSTVNQRRQNFFETAKRDGYTGVELDTRSTEDVRSDYNQKLAHETRTTDAPLIQSSAEKRLRTAFGVDPEADIKSLATEVANNAKNNPFPILQGKQTTTESVDSQEYDVSAEGKTILNTKNGAEDVEIKGVALTKGKEMTLELADGRKVSSKDITYRTKDEAIVYETVANMEVPTGIADVLIKNYSPEQSGSVYAFGIKQAYKYGYHNMPKAELMTREFFARGLTDTQLETAYNLGKGMGKADFKTTSKKKGYAKGGVIFDGDRSKLTYRQKTSLEAMEKVADLTGVQIRVFESDMVNGKRRGKNGSYNTRTGEIEIDLFAGADGQGIMLHTLAHELVHHIREQNAEEYKVLADFLMEQYGKKGVSVDALVRRQIEKAEASDRKISYAEAHEEVIADSMETMLTDGKAIEKLQMLQTKDPSLFERIKSAIAELIAKIKKAYKNVKPETLEGQIVASMLDEYETIQQMFVKALAGASENFKNADVDTSKSTSENDKIKHSFAGRKAKTSDIKTLETAIRLEDVGEATSEEIRQQTGWFRGMDGKWRFELDDSKMVIRDIDITGGETKLSEVIEHPELFAAYPQLKSITVSAFPSIFNFGLRGCYNRESKEIRLSDEFLVNTKAQKELAEIKKSPEYRAYKERLEKAAREHGEKRLELSKEYKFISITEEYRNWTELYYQLDDAQSFEKLREVEKEWKNSELGKRYYDIRAELKRLDEINPQEEIEKEFRESELGKRYRELEWDISGSELTNNKETRETLIHEIQHAVQDIEDFASGASEKYWNSVKSAYTPFEMRKLEKVTKEASDYFNMIEDEDIRDAAYRLWYLNDHYFDDNIDTNAVDEEISEIEQTAEALGYMDTLDRYFELKNKVTLVFNEIERRKRRAAQDLYFSTAGEIEARDVSNRLNMTDKERENTRPDIDRTDVVFAAGGVSYSQEYEQAEVNKSIVSLIEKVKKHQYKDNAKVEFGIISEKAANEIKKISGIDVSGYKIVIEARQIYHILKDHGINGEADHSMSDDNDIAKMEVAFNTYDKISDGGRTKAYTYMKNGHNRTAPTILYEKEIGEKSYYVVQAVPETKKRTLYIVTAFIGKKGYKKEASQLINAKSLDVTAKTGSVVTSNSIISNSTENVKQKQLEIIEKVNPAPNSYLTWIRKVEDIKTLSETLEDSEWSDYDEFDPSLTRGMLEEAIEKGEITVYSSYQIKQGTFVSPSYMEAKSYSGNGKVYEKTVKIDDVAWIDPTQGMYANIDEKYSGRDPNALTPRNLLANALEESAVHEVEKKKLAEYKDNIEKLYEKEQELYEVRKEIKELSFAPGKKDTAKIKKLQEKAVKLSNSVTFYDKKLLNLESTSFLKNVLEREKSKAIKRQKEKDAERLKAQKEKALQKEKEITERYQASRKKAVESRNKTAMRNKIKRVVNELNQYLLHGTKDKHVMDNMKKVVAEALNIIDMDTVGADERVEKYNKLIAEATDPDVIVSLTETRDRIQGQGDKLHEKLMSLKNAYADIINSNDPVVANAYDEVIENKILSVAQSIESTSIRNMSLNQLEEVYDLYRMVLTNIRDSNKAFKAGKDETIAELGYKVNSEVEDVTTQKYEISKFKSYISKFGWNELKPIYAFRMIGSDTFQRLFKNILRGQDVWCRDVEEGKIFQQTAKKKHGYGKWDFKKTYTFTAKSGKTFDLTLQQIMSLYAFSRRDQALNHLVQGGFVFDDDVTVTKKVKGVPVEYEVNTSTAFNLSPEIIGEIIDNLTPEQKSFVEEMQSFLSDTMGEKGNEVSLAMYGIKLYKEKFYFPLKSSEYYMNFTADEAGEVKLKNSGFSKETVKKANNPIVLSDFMDVWANHVNEMSTYHAFVLPIEDFSRVYNYRTPTSETETTKSLKNTLNNAFGSGVNKYIRQLLVDINGGARSELASPTDKITSLAKKGAVMLSASVVIQQPSALARAMAYVKPKYFVNVESFKFTKHNEKWQELKKYAPVAGIKEMGYFDTGMGRPSADWIVEDDYNGIREKLHAFFHDKDARKTLADDFLGKAPAMADELSWVALWEAVKKETAKETDLEPNTEAFLERCGERFTEVVELTQVYDSVLSRNGYMRDNGSFMKMATAFMAEPTIQANMLLDAGIQGKRNGKAGLKAATSVVGAVIGSIIVNTLLKSIVYAARDDEEDETQWEKYFGAVVGDLTQSLNPLTMLPFVKDIVSIFSGYDVERMDMSLISDLKDSILAIGSETKPTSDKILGLTGSIGQLFGIPVKNVIRDVKAVINTVNSLSKGTQTTKTGINFTLQDEVNSTITGNLLNKVFGVSFDTSSQKKYYDAVMGGDSVYAERMLASFKNPKNSIVESLKKYEPRILQAAQAEVDGKPNERYKIAKEIVADGFKQDYVVLAIQGTVSQLTKKEKDSKEKKQSLSTIANYLASAKNGETSSAKTHKEAIIEADMYNNGKTYEEAEERFFNSFNNAVKDAVETKTITVEKASELLEKFGNLDSESAQEKVQYLAFKRDYPDVEHSWSEKTVTKYYAVAEPADISVEVYDEYLVGMANCKGTDSDNDSKADSGTVKAEKLELIDSLPLNNYQKDVLYRMNGWSEKKLYQAPWH